LQTNLPKLKLLAKGKVRDIYALPDHPDKLLFVATDRISAFDVIMNNVSDDFLPVDVRRPSGNSRKGYHPLNAIFVLVPQARPRHS